MARKIQNDPRPRIESAGQWRKAPRPVDWIARVEHVLKRDGSCRWVEHGELCRSTERLEVDHINDPTNHELDNLRALCHKHHEIRTNAQKAAGTRAWRARTSSKRPAERHPGLLDNT